MKVLNNPNDQQAVKMLEMFKNAIETQEARSIMDKTSRDETVYPAYRHLNFSSNPPPPNDLAFRSRLLIKKFTQKDSHTPQQKMEFMRFMGPNVHKLRVLGNFAITYLLLHPEVLFKPNIEEINWEEAAKEVITNFYEMAGGLPRPSEWLDQPLRDTVDDENSGDEEDEEDSEADAINNIRSAVRTFLLNHVNETYNKYVRNLGHEFTDSNGRLIENEDLDLGLDKRIDFCINKDLSPYITKNRSGRVIITPATLDALHKYGGVSSDMVSSLSELATILKMKYGNIMIGGGAQRKGIYDENRDSLYNFIRDSYEQIY